MISGSLETMLLCNQKTIKDMNMLLVTFHFTFYFPSDYDVKFKIKQHVIIKKSLTTTHFWSPFIENYFYI